MKDSIFLQSDDELRSLVGPLDSNIRRIEAFLGIDLFVRDKELVVSGAQKKVEECKALLMYLLQEHQSGKHIDSLIADVIAEKNRSVADSISSAVSFSHNRKEITPRTPGQRKYVHAMQNSDVVFCVGPAGTGKTYLAMALAVEFLKTKRVERIILTRPAVEAGERLGFLPGDLRAKINPYLRPLIDALYEMIDAEEIVGMMEKNIIEVVPLAYMRGRTLNDAFVVLDEAQNTSPLQMKMFLTRLGFGSRMVVTGDVTQSDIPKGERSGMRDALARLKSVKHIKILQLTEKDVVRHSLVKEILKAYDKKNTTSKK